MKYRVLIYAAGGALLGAVAAVATGSTPIGVLIVALVGGIAGLFAARAQRYAPSRNGTRLGVSIGMGVGIGTAIGVAMGNVGAGIAIGIALGVALSGRRQDQSSDGERPRQG